MGGKEGGRERVGRERERVRGGGGKGGWEGGKERESEGGLGRSGRV